MNDEVLIKYCSFFLVKIELRAPKQFQVGKVDYSYMLKDYLDNHPLFYLSIHLLFLVDIVVYNNLVPVLN